MRFEIRYRDGKTKGSVTIKDAKDEEDARDKFSERVPADEILDVIDLSSVKHNRNMRRIRRARIALKAYLKSDNLASDTLKENVTDLLTDIRHLCAAKKIDFDLANRSANDHYSSEKSKSDPCFQPCFCMDCLGKKGGHPLGPR